MEYLIFTVLYRGFLSEPIDNWWTYDRDDLVAHLPNFTLPPQNGSTDHHFEVQSLGRAGSLTLGVESDSGKITKYVQTVTLSSKCSQLVSIYSANRVSIIISFVHSVILAVFSDVVGWIYFVAWSISFYPQIVTNYRRKR